MNATFSPTCGRHEHDLGSRRVLSIYLAPHTVLVLYVPDTVDPVCIKKLTTQQNETSPKSTALEGGWKGRDQHRERKTKRCSGRDALYRTINHKQAQTRGTCAHGTTDHARPMHLMRRPNIHAKPCAQKPSMRNNHVKDQDDQVTRKHTKATYLGADERRELQLGQMIKYG